MHLNLFSRRFCLILAMNKVEMSPYSSLTKSNVSLHRLLGMLVWFPIIYYFELACIVINYLQFEIGRSKVAHLKSYAKIQFYSLLYGGQSRS